MQWRYYNFWQKDAGLLQPCTLALLMSVSDVQYSRLQVCSEQLQAEVMATLLTSCVNLVPNGSALKENGASSRVSVSGGLERRVKGRQINSSL